MRSHVIPAQPTALAAQLGGLFAAFRFLTSLPLPGSHAAEVPGLQRALLYFPLVGLGIGGLLVGLDQVLSPLLERPLVDFVLLASLVFVSGGLHLDGLIDTADGLFDGDSAEQRLAAMRESWAGPRGAAAALSQLLLQYGALAVLPQEVRTASLLLGPMLGRWAIVYGYVAFPYARRTAGLSLALKQGATPVAAVGAGLFTLLVGLLLVGPSTLLLLAAAWLIALLAGYLALARLGGMSGDLYGAVEQVVETTTLLLVPVVSVGAR